jgi:Ca2+-binding EF-hand superfamily protein
VKIVNETIYLLSIYDKSSQSTIKENELNELLKEVGIG